MAPIRRPTIITAETQAEWQKAVLGRIWEMVTELQDYGPGLLEMVNCARIGMTKGQSIQDRIWFKMCHDQLRLAIGFMQASAPIYNIAQNALREHVVFDAKGNIIEATDAQPEAQIEDVSQQETDDV